MAKAIAWDGEGATCLLEVTCVNAASEADARTVAKSVASSSLAKAAFFGHDPNWGRIACAAGYSGQCFFFFFSKYYFKSRYSACGMLAFHHRCYV